MWLRGTCAGRRHRLDPDFDATDYGRSGRRRVVLALVDAYGIAAPGALSALHALLDRAIVARTAAIFGFTIVPLKTLAAKGATFGAASNQQCEQQCRKTRIVWLHRFSTPIVPWLNNKTTGRFASGSTHNAGIKIGLPPCMDLEIPAKRYQGPVAIHQSARLQCSRSLAARCGKTAPPRYQLVIPTKSIDL